MGNHPQADEAEANARLIAAAPELLGALEACVERFDVLIDAEEATEKDLDIRLIALEVIAKAKGDYYG